MPRISLGYGQWQALESLFEYGSPVHIETLENYPGNIVDVKVTYFAEDEVTQLTAKLTSEGWRYCDGRCETREGCSVECIGPKEK